MAPGVKTSIYVSEHIKPSQNKCAGAAAAATAAGTLAAGAASGHGSLGQPENGGVIEDRSKGHGQEASELLVNGAVVRRDEGGLAVRGGSIHGAGSVIEGPASQHNLRVATGFTGECSLSPFYMQCNATCCQGETMYQMVKRESRMLSLCSVFHTVRLQWSQDLSSMQVLISFYCQTKECVGFLRRTRAAAPAARPVT